MWLMLKDAFFSIVKKDCGPNEVLVRARRPGDIEKVFGDRYRATCVTDADYLYRAVIPVSVVGRELVNELFKIGYPNFKNAVKDEDLHDAYAKVWLAMSQIQNPPPYSTVPNYQKGAPRKEPLK